MTEASKPDYSRLMKDALLELKQLRTTLDDLQRAQREPIAIIGTGCRFPGGINSSEDFWRMLHEGVDAIGPVPKDRWDIDAYYDQDADAPGKMATRYGGFLSSIDMFDPAFFGISPREARTLDPQQRMLLEVTWEALEAAGQSPTALYGTSTGVFIGMSTFDYALHQVGGVVENEDLTRIDGYVATGSTMSPAAGRLSYVLGLNGPSLVVDTACSSSLVAAHLAIGSLRNHECDLALVGGVNLILRPEWNVNFTKAHMLAPDGRCKTFDASADGYSRGEGCGVVVLQRLSDAVKAGRNIMAVIRGSAVNQDGASGGLTVPSGPSQEQVIRRALENAAVRPADVSYVEAHGTGTALGDPIEVAALGAVFGVRPGSAPLRIGSVKTNIGHLEAAAGVAGLIKVALSLRHREIPPHLHFKRGNPLIDWDNLPIEIPVEPAPWLGAESPRRAGISSFGFTGTNAHVVLEEAPADTRSAETSPSASASSDRPVHVLTLSARTAPALRELARRYQDYLTRADGVSLADVAFTANTGRAHFRYRLAVVADSVQAARMKLAANAAGQPSTGVFTGEATIRSSDDGLAVVPSLPPGEGWEPMLTSLAERYVRGVSVDWTALDRNYARRPVELPTYPFQRERYWADQTRPKKVATSASTNQDAHSDDLYEIRWRERSLRPGAGPSTTDGRWIIMRDGSAVGEVLGAALEAKGLRVTFVSAAHQFERLDADHFLVDPGTPADLERAWTTIAAEGPIGGIVHLWSLDAASAPDADLRRHEPLESTVHLLQTVAKAGLATPPRIWCVTRGAAPTGKEAQGAALALAQAPMWGLGRVAAVEHPGLWGGLVDLDHEVNVHAETEALVRELLSSDDEDQVAFRGGIRFVPRLVRRSHSTGTELSMDPQGTYLVIGGLGALGLHAARWLISKGARTLVLAGRRGISSPGAATAVSELEAMGASVVVSRADASREQDVAKLLEDISGGPHPLRGIVHAAGVDAPVPLLEMTALDLRTMVAAKVRGAWLLHEQTRHLDLQLFLCFSSISSVWGAPALGHYAAANAFLDALAHERRRLGLVGLTVNWGPWRGGGMATDDKLRLFENSGVQGLHPTDALGALDALVAAGDTQTIVANIQWPLFRSSYEARRRRPFLSEIEDQPSADVPESPNREADWIARLQVIAPDERAGKLQDLLRAEVASTLGFHEVEAVPVDQSVFDLGMDSLRAVELAVRLQGHLGLKRSIQFFDCPQVRALALRLLDQIALTGEGAAAADARSDVNGLTLYSPGLEKQIFEFCRVAWPYRPQETIESRWRWMFLESARRLSVEPRVWLYREGGKVVGHHGAIPVRLGVGPETVDSAWFADTMVLEQHRSNATGARVILDSNEEFRVGLSLGQTEQMRKIALRLGWVQVAPLQTYVLLLHPGRVLRDKLNPVLARVVGWGSLARQSLKRLAAGSKDQELSMRRIDRFESRHDRLWDTVKAEYPCAVTRDASYLNWKYVTQPGQDFVRLEFLRDGKLAALAVLALDEPGVIFRYRRALIVDLVISPSNSALVLGVLNALRRHCASLDVDAMFFHLINEKLEASLRAYGFMQRKPTRFLLVNPHRTSSDVRDALITASNWLVTMGDSDIDRPWEMDGNRRQIRTTRVSGHQLPQPSPTSVSGV